MRLTALILVLHASTALAQPPATISYQGVLTDAGGTPLPDGNYNITFRLYDAASGGAPLWEEGQLLLVQSGVFNAGLGSVVTLDLPFDVPYWLGTSVSAQKELTPRTPLTSSPYSFNARAIEDGAVSGDKIAQETVVRSLNGLRDDLRVVAGEGVSITAAGDSIEVSASGTNGGEPWRLEGNSGASLDTAFLGSTDDHPIELHVAGERAFRLEPTDPSEGPNVIGGSPVNGVNAGVVGATIGGGGDALDAGSPNPNMVTGRFGTVSGGAANTAGHDATVGGGFQNTATGTQSTVAGGRSNTAGGFQATVAGGVSNQALGSRSFIGGGSSNRVTGTSSAVLGGESCEILSSRGIAAGRRAKIGSTHHGAILFADQTNLDFDSVTSNELAVRATGGARIVTAVDGSGTPTAGVQLAAGGAAWQALSDRDAKEHIAPVEPSDVLRRVLEMPISTWSYKTERGVRHIGPMAQDFSAQLGVGSDERYITTTDADGAALAAIQGLHAEIEKRDAVIRALEARLARLECRIAEVKSGESTPHTAGERGAR